MNLKVSKSYPYVFIAGVAFLFLSVLINVVLFYQLFNPDRSESAPAEEGRVAERQSSAPYVDELDYVDVCNDAQKDSYQKDAAHFYQGDFIILRTVLDEEIDGKEECLDIVYTLPYEIKRDVEEVGCYEELDPWICRNEHFQGWAYSQFLYKIVLDQLYIVDVDSRTVIANDISFDPTVNQSFLFEISDDGPRGLKIYKQGKKIFGLSNSKRYLLYRIGGDAYPTNIRNREACRGETKCIEALDRYEGYVDQNGGNGLFMIDLEDNEVARIPGLSFGYYDPVDVKWIDNCDVFEYSNLLSGEIFLYDATTGERVQLVNPL